MVTRACSRSGLAVLRGEACEISPFLLASAIPPCQGVPPRRRATCPPRWQVTAPAARFGGLGQGNRRFIPGCAYRTPYMPPPRLQQRASSHPRRRMSGWPALRDDLGPAAAAEARHLPARIRTTQPFRAPHPAERRARHAHDAGEGRAMRLAAGPAVAMHDPPRRRIDRIGHRAAQARAFQHASVQQSRRDHRPAHPPAQALAHRRQRQAAMVARLAQQAADISPGRRVSANSASCSGTSRPGCPSPPHLPSRQAFCIRRTAAGDIAVTLMQPTPPRR